MSTKNYFQELELHHSASADDVRSAYKKLAKQWHPDKNQAEGAEDKFKRILEAYNHLKSDDRRELHASEIKRAKESKNVPKTSNTSAGGCGVSKNNQATKQAQPTKEEMGTKPKEKNWWESFRQKPKAKTNNKTRERPKTGKSDEKFHTRTKSPGLYAFMHSFMGSGYGSFADPFDEMIFDIFMVAPEKAPPKSKSFTDPFGNKLPKNVEEDLYDWKSATRPTGNQPDYQEYHNHETEFACHYCGMMMSMDTLRKHEPKCLRFGGGKKPNPEYQFADEDVNESYATHQPFSPKSSQSNYANSNRKIKCQWCGTSISKPMAAEHIAQCKSTSTSQPKPKRKSNQARPEWNNNFTDSEYNDTPEHVIFGEVPTRRTKSPFITINDFDPFTSRGKPTGTSNPCWKCKLEYGVHAVHVCSHVH